jgi:hypothetical protein
MSGSGAPIAMARWSRDVVESASIKAQSRIYCRLEHIRDHIPDDSGLEQMEPFFAPLVTISAFDLGQGRIGSFAAYRFLYERLLGGAVRPWLPGAFCAAAALPHLHPEKRRSAVAVDQRVGRDRGGLVEPRALLLSGVGRQDRGRSAQLRARLRPHHKRYAGLVRHPSILFDRAKAAALRQAQCERVTRESPHHVVIVRPASHRRLEPQAHRPASLDSGFRRSTKRFNPRLMFERDAYQLASGAMIR